MNAPIGQLKQLKLSKHRSISEKTLLIGYGLIFSLPKLNMSSLGQLIFIRPNLGPWILFLFTAADSLVCLSMKSQLGKGLRHGSCRRGILIDIRSTAQSTGIQTDIKSIK